MAEGRGPRSAAAHVVEERVAPGDLDARLRSAREPFVARGLAADWPLVRAGMDERSARRVTI